MGSQKLSLILDVMFVIEIKSGVIEMIKNYPLKGEVTEQFALIVRELVICLV